MIEFIEEQHIYLVDGVIVPCVSDILHFIFPDKYKGVNKDILNSKAKYGSTIHKAIECLEKGLNLPKLDYIQESSINQYEKLKNKYHLRVLSQEKRIQYKKMYAGTYDMESIVEGLDSLVDIKTTAILDEEYLSWQLSYYELASGKRFKKLYAIWLPKKELGQLVEIKRKTKNELLQKLKEYEGSEEYVRRFI